MMGIYQDQVLPRVTDAVIGRLEFIPIRERVSAAHGGEAPEIGFGSGLNVPHYPAAVTRVRAVDPGGAENLRHLGKGPADRAGAFGMRRAGLGPTGDGMIFGSWA